MVVGWKGYFPVSRMNALPKELFYETACIPPPTSRNICGNALQDTLNMSNTSAENCISQCR